MSADKRHKIQRRVKRQRQKVERRVHLDRTRPGQVFRVYPDPDRPFVVEVRLCRDRRRMREAVDFHSGEREDEIDDRVRGMVRTWHGIRTRRAGVLRPRMVVARMFLNVRDLQVDPNNIIPHECGHAALGYARFLGVSLAAAQRDMPLEEIVCYAIGELNNQICKQLHVRKVWG